MIDDLELDAALSGFRDDVPEMSETAFAIGKLQLQSAMATPAAPIPHPMPILTRIEVVEAKRRSPPRKLTPWLAAAAAVATVAVGAGLVLGGGQATQPEEAPLAALPNAPAGAQPVYPPAPPRPPAVEHDKNGTPLPAATEPLNAAGDLAAHVSDPPQTPGQYLYMDRREWGMPYAVAGIDGGDIFTHAGKNESFWEEWVPTDRAGVWQLSRDARTGLPNPPLPGDPALPNKVSGLSKWEGTFQAPGGGYFPAPGTWMDPTKAFMASLSRDPKTLYQRLVTDSADSNDPPALALEMAQSVLSRPASPDLRRALYTALSYHPWVVVDQNAKTRDGRAAVSIGVENVFTDKFEAVLVDPANGRAIGTKSTHLKDDGDRTKAGDVWIESTLTWTVVNHLGDNS